MCIQLLSWIKLPERCATALQALTAFEWLLSTARCKALAQLLAKAFSLASTLS